MQLLHLLLVITLIPCLTTPPAVRAWPVMRHPAVGSMPGVYLALGDSLAVGVGATAPTGGYVARLFAFFQDPRHANITTLTNLAVPGETSTSFITTSVGPPAQLAQALAAIAAPTDVQVVTLDIGANDLVTLLQVEPCRSAPASVACQAAVAVVLTTFAQNYAGILQHLAQALAGDPGDERLLVMTYYNAYSGTGSPYEGPADAAWLGSDQIVDCTANATDPLRVGLNDVITCLGRLYGSEIVDVYPPFKGNALVLTHIGTGDIHPNDQGYAVIAHTFTTVFLAGRIIYLPRVQR
jgi:lysophospholipase L1-like esterase